MFLPRIESETGSIAKIKRFTNLLDLEKELIDSKIIAVLVDLEDSREIWEPILIELRSRLEKSTVFIRGR